MKKFKVALQLYSVREEMAKDMDKTLGAVKAMGYDYVEFAGYYGRSAEEVKALLDKHGLTCMSVHQGPNLFLEEGQKAVDYIKTLGVKYSVIPWYERSRLAGTDKWEETIESFTKIGKLLKDNGIKMLYHNHDFEFETEDGKYLLDILFDTMPKELISPQFDTGWVTYSGENPAKYIEKYAGRVDIIHLKDFTAKKLKSGPVYALIDDSGVAKGGGTLEENGFSYKALGDGMLDVKAILEAAEKCGTEYIVVEFDRSPDMPELDSAKRSREFLKTLGQ